MPTTVVKSIGTSSRDYSTLQAWEDACPANLVTADQIWRGECYNDSEFTGTTALLLVSGITTDATRYIELTAASGQSFVDNANVQTNALRYNASNGVAIRSSVYTGITISTASNSLKFKISRLQIQHTGLGTPLSVSGTSAGLRSDVNQCIVDTTFGNTSYVTISAIRNVDIRNSLVLLSGNNNMTTLVGVSTDTNNLINCTLINAGTGTITNGVRSGGYGTYTLKNCYLGGTFTNATGEAATKTTCYTSLSGPPSGWSSAAYSTSSGAYFQNITAGSLDFRIKTDSVLKDAGTTDSTNAATDIAGTSRPSGSAYDVGAWEFVSAGGTTHTNTGSLASQSASIAGTATHKTLHATSGALASQSSAIAGSATRVAGFVTHTTSGSLSAVSATVSGTAVHPHVTSGALAAQSAIIVGIAERPVAGLHDTTGALASGAATIAGTAVHVGIHATNGALAAQAAIVVGIAERIAFVFPAISRPESDVVGGQWLASTGSDKWAMVDEVVLDTGDYVYANATALVQRFKLAAVAAGTSPALTYVVDSSTGNGIIVTLQEGTTDIASETRNPLPATPTSYTLTLTALQIAAITDWTNLYLKIESV